MNYLLLPILAISLAATGCVGVSQHSLSGQNSTTSSFEHSHHQGPGAPQWQGADKLTLTYSTGEHTAVLDSDRVTLIFPNLSAGEVSSFSFQGGELHIRVGGDGTSESTVIWCRNNDTATFHSRYENGINTIQFFGRTIKLSNQARLVIANGAAVIPTANDNSNSKQIVHVR